MKTTIKTEQFVELEDKAMSQCLTNFIIDGTPLNVFEYRKLKRGLNKKKIKREQ